MLSKIRGIVDGHGSGRVLRPGQTCRGKPPWSRRFSQVRPSQASLWSGSTDYRPNTAIRSSMSSWSDDPLMEACVTEPARCGPQVLAGDQGPTVEVGTVQPWVPGLVGT